MARTVFWILTFALALTSRGEDNLTIGLDIADYLLDQQNADGCIPDTPDGAAANEDSNMEYALLGLAAAYWQNGDTRYLNGLTNGIRWLAEREEMNDPFWRGSWFYAYAATPPYMPYPVSPGDPAIEDVRGVDATSALFVYLLYLHQILSGDTTLAAQYESHARAALDFILARNQSTNGFFCSSWQKWTNDAQWHLWQFCYTADQADVYLGLQAGWTLYRDPAYRSAALFLKEHIGESFFIPTPGRYAVGLDEYSEPDTDLEGFNGVFPQGYLPWVFGTQGSNDAAFAWLRNGVQADGSLICFSGDPRYSLSAALYAAASTALKEPCPTNTLAWIKTYPYDPVDGGVRDTVDPESEKIANVSGFCAVALLGFPAVPEIRIASITPGDPTQISFDSWRSAEYTLDSCSSPLSGMWSGVAGASSITGTGEALLLADTNAWPTVFYRLRRVLQP